MLNIWSLADRGFVEKFCRLHGELSGEYFDSAQIDVYRSPISPYNGYEFIRLNIKPHVFKRDDVRTTISARAVSYALLAQNPSSTEYKLIPLQENATSLYTVNDLLGEKITATNVVSYMTFAGHILSRPPFYFFDRLAQIDSLISNVPPSQVKEIRATLTRVFGYPESDSLDLQVVTHSHSLLGKYLSLRIPCLFRGHLYITRLRVSTAGVPHMDNDDALNIEGMFDEEENLVYYPLDSSPALAAICAQKARITSRAEKTIGGTLLANSVLQWLVLPLFAFNLFVLMAFGWSDTTTLAYFGRLQDSRTLTVICLLLGISGTAITVFQYLFIQLLLYLRPFVPNRWTILADKAEEQARAAATRFGLVKFTIINIIEFCLRTFMALTLLLYGLSNLRLPALPAINFGQAAMTIVARIPVVGNVLVRLVGSNYYTSIQYSTAVGVAIHAIVTLLFSTIIVGLILRQVALARSKA